MHGGVEIECVWDAECVLGEGPIWDDRTATLYFVDIRRGQLLSYRGAAAQRRFAFDGLLSAAVTREEDADLLCATSIGLQRFDPVSGRRTHLGSIEPDRPGNRTNDGKVDPAGRLWIGTVDDAEKAFTGALYRIDAGGRPARVLDDIGVSNGLDWSPDGAVMYFTDSRRRTIWWFDFDVDSGALGEREVFATVPEDAGWPDGLTVDAEGFVWGAHWDGGRVTRYDPDGRIDRVIAVPVPRVSSVCFGGPDLDILYMTSARIALSAAQLREAPLSGALLACRPQVRGRPAFRARA